MIAPGPATGASTAGASADPDADAVAAAVLACPSVAGLSGGRAGEIASYLPGWRVAGVRLQSGAVTVHVVARYGRSVAEIAGEVTTAVRAVAGPIRVEVGIDDLDVDLAAVRARIEDTAVAHARRALDDPDLPARLESTLAPRRHRRVR